MKYILKLQLHQHSLLTRKVFSRHNFHHWSSSVDLLVICILQVFFVFKYSLSSIHLRLWIRIVTGSGSSSLDLDHHSIWIIITRSGSSLDLDHHHWICIITRSGSSLLDHHWSSSQVLSLDSSRHRKFYRANPFSCWL